MLFSAWMFLFALSCRTSCGGESTAPPATAEAPAQGAIDEYVNREMENQRIPGLSLAVVRAGKIVQTKGYGKASLELNAPATDGTLYGLGSISKQFTSIYRHGDHAAC
jgi:CubicO group peptidase (beta-lactamase class C family)